MENALDPFSFFPNIMQHDGLAKALCFHCEAELFCVMPFAPAICLLTARDIALALHIYSPSALFICLFVHHAAHCDVRCGCTRRQNNFSQSVKSIPRAQRSTHLSGERALAVRENSSRETLTLCVSFVLGGLRYRERERGVIRPFRTLNCKRQKKPEHTLTVRHFLQNVCSRQIFTHPPSAFEVFRASF